MTKYKGMAEHCVWIVSGGRGQGRSNLIHGLSRGLTDSVIISGGPYDLDQLEMVVRYNRNFVLDDADDEEDLVRRIRVLLPEVVVRTITVSP